MNEYEDDGDGPEPDTCPYCGNDLPLAPTSVITTTYNTADTIEEWMGEPAPISSDTPEVSLIERYTFNYLCYHCGQTHVIYG